MDLKETQTQPLLKQQNAVLAVCISHGLQILHCTNKYFYKGLTESFPFLAAVNPSVVQTLYDNPYTMEIDTTSQVHKCIQADGTQIDCAVANATYSGTTCSNVVKEVCTVKLQWLEHAWLVYHSYFELLLKSLGKNSMLAADTIIFRII